MDKVKIAAISDLHGFLPELKEPADILLIAGDIIPIDIQFNKPATELWLCGEFKNWIKSLPVEKVYLVAGNHDAYFESRMNLMLLKIAFEKIFDSKLTYLQNETARYVTNSGKLITIFGSPYCVEFGNWPFMRTTDYLVNAFKDIPDQCDIIVVHNPPYNLSDSDVILDEPVWNNQKVHLGSIPLTERLKGVDFKLLVCGHIHSGSHDLVNKVVNVSYLDESYTPTYPIFYTEIEV